MGGNAFCALPTHPLLPQKHNRIFPRMSETYAAKRERWQRLSESLPEGLRGQVSLRNVEAVAGLPPAAQTRLAEALRAGLKRLPQAVAQLRIDPNTPLADLLHPAPRTDAALDAEAHAELAGVIQACFPDMPPISAEALAGSEVLDIARQVVQVHQRLFESAHLRTDFVVTILHELLCRTLARLEAHIEETPALRQAPGQAPGKDQNWRNQDA